MSPEVVCESGFRELVAEGVQRGLYVGSWVAVAVVALVMGGLWVLNV